MVTRRERIEKLLNIYPGLTDREITDQLEGHTAPQQPINILARRMESQGSLIRKKRSDGLIGNYLVKSKTEKPASQETQTIIRPAHNQAAESLIIDSTVSSSLQKLIDLGFEEVGYWFLEAGNLSFTLHKHRKEINILYAFIVNGEVKYIGKSIQTLYKRIFLYKQGVGTQLTNIRVKQEINSCLSQGSPVTIYALIQKIPMDYKGIPINLAAGIEDNLIKLQKPEWNKR